MKLKEIIIRFLSFLIWIGVVIIGFGIVTAAIGFLVPLAAAIVIFVTPVAICGIAFLLFLLIRRLCRGKGE